MRIFTAPFADTDDVFLHTEINKPFSLSGHVESQEDKKLCFCMASPSHTLIQCNASRAKTKLFILLRLKMAAERDRSMPLIR